MSLGNRCGFYSRRDVYRTSDLSCKGSIKLYVVRFAAASFQYSHVTHEDGRVRQPLDLSISHI